MSPKTWRSAQEHRAAVLARNARDFLALVGDAGHHGLLLAYRSNDVTRDLRATAIAAAVTKVGATFPEGIADRIIVLNQFAS